MRALRNGLTRILEFAVTVIVAVLVLDVLWGVCSRFVLGEPSAWTEELATFLLIWVALLGSAVGFSRQKHLGVDYFVNQLHPDARRLMAIVVQGLVAAFAASAMVWGGYILVSETLKAGQLTPALGIRMGMVYLAVPISGLFIVLFAIEQMLELIANPSESLDANLQASKHESES